MFVVMGTVDGALQAEDGSGAPAAVSLWQRAVSKRRSFATASPVPGSNTSSFEFLPSWDDLAATVGNLPR